MRVFLISNKQLLLALPGSVGSQLLQVMAARGGDRGRPLKRGLGGRGRGRQGQDEVPSTEVLRQSFENLYTGPEQVRCSALNLYFNVFFSGLQQSNIHWI